MAPYRSSSDSHWTHCKKLRCTRPASRAISRLVQDVRKRHKRSNMKKESSSHFMRAGMLRLRIILATACVVAMATLLTSGARAADTVPLVLAEQGQPRAVIIVEPDPPAPPEVIPAKPADP